MGVFKAVAACIHTAMMHISDGLSAIKPIKNSPNENLTVCSIHGLPFWI